MQSKLVSILKEGSKIEKVAKKNETDLLKTKNQLGYLDNFTNQTISVQDPSDIQFKPKIESYLNPRRFMTNLEKALVS